MNALVVGNGSYIVRPCGHDLHGPTSRRGQITLFGDLPYRGGGAEASRPLWGRVGDPVGRGWAACVSWTGPPLLRMSRITLKIENITYIYLILRELSVKNKSTEFLR